VLVSSRWRVRPCLGSTRQGIVAGDEGLEDAGVLLPPVLVPRLKSYREKSRVVGEGAASDEGAASRERKKGGRRKESKKEIKRTDC